MGNSIEKPNGKIVYGEIITNKNKRIDMPPKNSNSIGASAITLFGEMAIDLVPHTYIKDDNGKVVARIDHNRHYMTSVEHRIDEKTAAEATRKYMEEKGIKSIEEVIEASKITNIEEFKQRKASVKKASGYGRGE